MKILGVIIAVVVYVAIGMFVAGECKDWMEGMLHFRFDTLLKRLMMVLVTMIWPLTFMIMLTCIGCVAIYVETKRAIKWLIGNES